MSGDNLLLLKNFMISLSRYQDEQIWASDLLLICNTIYPKFSRINIIRKTYINANVVTCPVLKSVSFC